MFFIHKFNKRAFSVILVWMVQVDRATVTEKSYVVVQVFLLVILNSYFRYISQNVQIWGFSHCTCIYLPPPPQNPPPPEILNFVFVCEILN